MCLRAAEMQSLMLNYFLFLISASSNGENILIRFYLFFISFAEGILWPSVGWKVAIIYFKWANSYTSFSSSIGYAYVNVLFSKFMTSYSDFKRFYSPSYTMLSLSATF